MGCQVLLYNIIVDIYSTADDNVTDFIAYLDSTGTVVLNAVREESEDGIGELTGVRVVSGEELEQTRTENGL